MKLPTLWKKYTREEAQETFLPGSKFNRGTWGMIGIVQIPRGQTKDFVLFVNLEQHYTDVFEESIDTDGVLTWQSQPSQTLASPVVQSLIHHRDNGSRVHLFLKTLKSNTKGIYTYMGELQYLAHDVTREKPVHFKWALQVLPSQAALLSIPLVLKPAAPGVVNTVKRIPTGNLQTTGKPLSSQPSNGTPLNSKQFRAFRRDFEQDEARNREIGLAGEKLVLENEKKRLVALGKPHLATKVEHVSLIRGDGLGYDILSYSPSGEKIFIEVKTTTGGESTPFYISPNELKFSELNAANYKLVRVYDFDVVTGSGMSYELLGDLTLQLQLQPTEFRASVK